MEMKKTIQRQSGLSLVELMVGITVFIVAIVAVARVHQQLLKNELSNRLSQKALDFVIGETTRLNRISRMPERDSDDGLVYRDANNDVVTVGGSLVPYGFNTLLDQSALGGVNGEIVTYPDALAEDSYGIESKEHIKLRRTFSVTPINIGQPDECKQIVITLSDVQDPPRFKSISQQIVIKKPHPLALDTRLARGAGDLYGQVLDADSRQPITPTSGVLITLTPNDNTPARYNSPNADGTFFFSPPLNTAVGYTLKIEQPETHWSRTIPLSLRPGHNILAGDSGYTIFLATRVYADVKARIVSADNSGPLSDMWVQIQLNGTAPNGRPGTFVQRTDNTGVTTFHIEIPEPGLKTYPGVYYWSAIWPNYGGYLPISTFANAYLSLDSANPIDQTFNMVSEKHGNLTVAVNNQDSTPNTKAQVTLYYPNISPDNIVGQAVTDNTGMATISNIVVNDVDHPYQNSKSVYLTVQSALHQSIGLDGDVSITVNADQNTHLQYVMAPHIIYWESPHDEIVLEQGIPQTVTSIGLYSGHNTNHVDIVMSPDSFQLGPFLDEAVTEYHPAQLTYTFGDPSMVSTNFPYADYHDEVILTGLTPGHTTVTIQDTLNFHWAGTPQSITMSQVVPITVVNTGIFGVTISPDGEIAPPNGNIIFSADSDNPPSDLVYTWTVTGNGFAAVVYLDGNGNPTANGTTSAARCKVIAGNVIGNTYTVTVQVRTASLGRQGEDTQTRTVQIAPLSVTMDPSGTQYGQPGWNSPISCVPQGGSGSGNYSFSWSLVDPNTQAPANPAIATLSATDTDTPVLTGLKIGNVSAICTVTDLSINETASGTFTLDIVPAGGTSQ